MSWYLFNLPRIAFLRFQKLIFQVIQVFVKPTKNQLLFFASEPVWGDNLKDFYNYCNATKTLNTPILVKDKNLFYQLRSEGFENIFYANTLKAFSTFFRSEGVVIYNGSSKLHFFPYTLLPDLKPIFNLWHGIPLKKIGRKVGIHRKKMAKYLFQEYSLFFVCSPTEAGLIQDCFNVGPEVTKITGSSRNDLFYHTQNASQFIKELNGKKVFLYAPTWREYGDSSMFFPWENYNLAELEEFLNKENIALLLRGHRQEISRSKGDLSLIKSSTNIFLAGNDVFPDANELLANTDVLITDYSSIYLDFILLNKPVVFIPYDLEKYSQYRGFLMDYDSNTPGRKVITAEEFIPNLKSCLDHPEQHEDERIQIKRKFHQFEDGNSSKRILSEIRNFLKHQ